MVSAGRGRRPRRRGQCAASAAAAGEDCVAEAKDALAAPHQGQVQQTPWDSCFPDSLPSSYKIVALLYLTGCEIENTLKSKDLENAPRGQPRKQRAS